MVRGGERVDGMGVKGMQYWKTVTWKTERKMGG